MSDRLAVVGDVHGEARKLAAMLDLLGRDRQIVLLGDYVDRGPDSKAVIGQLIEHKRRLGDNLVLLAGNHETELVRFLDSGDFVRFASLGGMSTIRSYVGVARGGVHEQFRSSLPAEHDALLRTGLQTYLETDQILISHAGFDPMRPGYRGRSVVVDGSYPAIFESAALPRTTVVVGHYVQKAGIPFVGGGLIGLDTGCGTTGGPLTALLWPEMEFRSV